jgi:hypothetical protein
VNNQFHIINTAIIADDLGQLLVSAQLVNAVNEIHSVELYLDDIIDINKLLMFTIRSGGTVKQKYASNKQSEIEKASVEPTKAKEPDPLPVTDTETTQTDYKLPDISSVHANILVTPEKNDKTADDVGNHIDNDDYEDDGNHKGDENLSENEKHSEEEDQYLQQEVNVLGEEAEKLEKAMAERQAKLRQQFTNMDGD